MKKECPACAEETFIASRFPDMDLIVRSHRASTSPVNQLCANHRKERKSVDKTSIDLLSSPRRWIDWQPIDLELVRNGYLARVTRQLSRAGRWRWSVTPVEVVQRSPTSVVEHAHARGYAKGREHAFEMAEAAIVALKKAEREERE